MLTYLSALKTLRSPLKQRLSRQGPHSQIGQNSAPFCKLQSTIEARTLPEALRLSQTRSCKAFAEPDKLSLPAALKGKPSATRARLQYIQPLPHAVPFLTSVQHYDLTSCKFALLLVR